MAKAGPLVSVVIGVHNGERYLAEALMSVFQQSYSELEVIVVDDGSTDSTPEILAQWPDSRLRVLTNPARQGLARALNRGIERSNGTYIARMDADDICHPERIERQVCFMELNHEVGLLGTACRLIDEAGRVCGVVQHPTSDPTIRWRLLFAPPLAHPSVMLRREVLKQDLRYDPAWPVAQDYELWPRLLRQCRGANLTETLLDYRVHGNSVSVAKREEQDGWALRVCERESRPFLPRNVPCTMLAPIRRALYGMPRVEDPSASQLRLQLLHLANNYMRQARLRREEEVAVRRDVIATVLGDSGFIRPFDRHSLRMYFCAMALDPLATVQASARLARHFLKQRT